ncbi:hypothetical protein Q31b_37930 [Novipirellula aureliae]|uniref:Uncharacterized protein n=1 Tax=Novipirellula aureliae TaxID=2527966 RepID=A0A5C6DR73_9BACT|nr:hypothetical protein Q31b_37930 [Novipirellula aureliae]
MFGSDRNGSGKSVLRHDRNDWDDDWDDNDWDIVMIVVEPGKGDRLVEESLGGVAGISRLVLRVAFRPSKHRPRNRR